MANVDPQTQGELEQKINDGHYKTILPNLPGVMRWSNAGTSTRAAYKASQSVLHAKLVSDAYRILGGSLPKAKLDLIWEYAYAERRSGGMGEVVTLFSDLVDLVEKCSKAL